MAEEVGRVDTYDTAYNLQSNLSHSSMRAINTYLRKDEVGIRVEVSENDTWVEETLVTAFDFFYHLILLWNEQMSLGLDEKLKDLVDRYAKEVGKINNEKIS